jgi:AAHS family 3-hydroxyphenylpropionic acid transporter
MLGRIAARADARLVVAVCFLITALEGYDIQACGVAAPKLIPELGLNPGQQGWVASAAMIGLVFGAFVGGWLADRTGRKPVLLASVVGFGLFSVWTALSHDYGTLVLARLATGIGFGGALPNLIAIAAEISAPRRRAATTSAMFCGMPAGGAAVALLAKLAGPHLDWRATFLIGGALPLLLAPLAFLLLPETRPDHDPAADRNLWTALFGEGRAAPTLLLWLANLLTLVVLYLMLNWLPTLVVAKGHAAGDGAAAALAFNLVGVAGALLLGFVVDRVGFRWSLLVTYGALAFVMLSLGGARPLDLILGLSAAAGFLVLGAQYSLYALAPTLYAPQVRAAGAGAAVGVGRFGSIIGPLLAGELRQAGWSAGQVLGAMLPVVLAAGAAIFALTYLVRRYDD